MKYPIGTRRHKSRNMKIKTVKKRCPNGTHRRKSRCVKKSKLKTIKLRGGTLPTTYIITVHDSNGEQIKDMDYSIDDPLDFIYKVEEKVNVRNIIMMSDIYVGKYIQLMGLNYKTLDDIDDDERGSLWTVTTDKQLANSYNIEYEGKMYIVKFHNINNIITPSFHKRKRSLDDDEPELLNDTMKNMKI